MQKYIGWILFVVIVAISLLYFVTTVKANSTPMTYKGWRVPDSFCQTHVDSPHYLHCIKAQRVVYTTFPNATQRGAMLVSRCETGQTYDRWATNRYSRTAGLFQVHPGNIGRYVRWGHRHIVIDRHLYNSWVNAKAALFLSQGGRNWREWDPVCHP